MCVAMATAALVMAGISTAVSTAGIIMQGQTAKSAADANATVQRQTAISVENQGAEQAAQQQLKSRKIAASQRAGAAAGGVVTDTGTPSQLQTETATFGERDALRITNNAARTAWGYQSQANIDEYQGSQAQAGSFLSAGASLLGGASNAYFGYKAATR